MKGLRLREWPLVLRVNTVKEHDFFALRLQSMT